MTTWYRGIPFRTQLEAQWACFFDLVGWAWQYDPGPVANWHPEFRVKFPCGHSECGDYHELLVDVKPYRFLSQFDDRPCRLYTGSYLINSYHGLADIRVAKGEAVYELPTDGAAAFGDSPSVTYWEMSHGAGGGAETLGHWVKGDVMGLWAQAREVLQRHSRLRDKIKTDTAEELRIMTEQPSLLVGVSCRNCGKFAWASSGAKEVMAPEHVYSKETGTKNLGTCSGTLMFLYEKTTSPPPFGSAPAPLGPPSTGRP